MNQRYLVALDQGTTSSRAVVFSLEGRPVASAAFEFRQIYPRPGWVEHDPEDILSTQIEALRLAVRRAQINPAEIAAIGIANQRETTLLWERASGKCVYHAIVWQCRRSAEYVDKLKSDGLTELIRQRTGLVADAYFSATKLQWLLDNLSLHDEAQRGQLCFGTVDSFLAWHLVQGHPHVTDATNASRTMLFDLQRQQWDQQLLDILRIPAAILPKVVDTAAPIGVLREDILGAPVPVAALAGDQHAALFGQACYAPGMVKNTYGTGCFMLMNTGDHLPQSQRGLLSTMAWRIRGKPTYALEGSVFMAGATIQWLRDELGIIASAKESEALARTVSDTGGVYLVPAFAGLGAPHWDMYARGTLVGMTRGTNRAHLARAALEAIAFQSHELLTAMAADAGQTPPELRVDGGACANGLLMQFQADIMALPIVRPAVLETTALGAALLAGCAVGVCSPDGSTWQQERRFAPQLDDAQRQKALSGWRRAVDAALYWAEEEHQKT